MERTEKDGGIEGQAYPEYVSRREEGRCFHCGGAYSYGHRCPNKHHRVIIHGKNEEDDEGNEQQGQDCEEKEAEEGNRESSMNLSVLSAGRLTPPQTMVLIDSGASHNFILATLV